MLMEVPNNREMVMSIPTDEGIIGWLRAKKRDKDRSGGVTLAIELLVEDGLGMGRACRVRNINWTIIAMFVDCMNDDDDHEPAMDEMLEGVADLARHVDDKIIVAVSNAPEYRYPDMRDREDLAALDDAMMPGDEDVEMAQLRARIRAELVGLWRNAG
ncbi:hypothetical protein LOK49_LG01G03082 [Camellia lanceoleosa]|uniref:Uncharacterized protein n=1 Tax=Camellia lanceoleosa TaxID=1840588 RepID=A0ACC0IW63_9ERIC|nr:hypothetical protein LOK49_LG01G03082 [Camellia lanceoleosa]